MKRDTVPWRDVPGLGGKYQVSLDGRVRNVNTGTVLHGAGAFGSYYSLYLGDHKKRTFTIATLLGMTWIGEAPPGFHYYHKNGIPTDHHARNIGIKSQAELFAMANNARKRELVQLDRTGEITATFPSIREAARRLPFTRPAIRCRCDGYFIKYGRKYQNRSVFASDGYAYAWDTEECVERALLQIEEETKGDAVIVSLAGYREPESRILLPDEWLEAPGGGHRMKGHGIDVWRDIAGYGGKYQACITGQVRRVFGSGRTRLMTPYKRSRNSRSRKVCRNRLFVKLTDDNGRSKEVAMLKIMAETFLPPAPPGCIPYHKNGIVTDNWVSNIGYISREELGRRTGHISKAQGVVRIGEDGELLETWRSAREAAKHSFMSYQTIIDRCNGFYMRNGSRHGFKRIQAPDGYVYAWDEEGCIRRALRRLAEESSGKPVIVSLEGYEAEPAAPPPGGGCLRWDDIEQ